MKLDKLDCQILHLLEHSSNLTFSDIAKSVRQGRDRVEYRIKRFEELGFIKSYIPIINHYNLGRTIYKNYLRLNNNKHKKNLLIKTLKGTTNVFWIAETSGATDLIFSISTKNIFDFYTIQGEIFNKFSDLIISYDVYPIVDFTIFRRKYLKEGTHYFSISGNLDLYLDELNLDILRILSINSRKTYKDIAEELNITTRILDSRINYLEKNKIILGYQTQLDLIKINRTIYKAQLDIVDFSLKFVDELFRFCNHHKLIIEFIKQVGKYRLEIQIEAIDYNEYLKVIDEITEKFNSGIRNIEMIIIGNEHFTWSNFKI